LAVAITAATAMAGAGATQAGEPQARCGLQSGVLAPRLPNTVTCVTPRLSCPARAVDHCTVRFDLAARGAGRVTARGILRLHTGHTRRIYGCGPAPRHCSRRVTTTIPRGEVVDLVCIGGSTSRRSIAVACNLNNSFMTNA
jgi:hypothetical protein